MKGYQGGIGRSTVRKSYPFTLYVMNYMYFLAFQLIQEINGNEKFIVPFDYKTNNYTKSALSIFAFPFFCYWLKC